MFQAWLTQTAKILRAPASSIHCRDGTNTNMGGTEVPLQSGNICAEENSAGLGRVLDSNLIDCCNVHEKGILVAENNAGL